MRDSLNALPMELLAPAGGMEQLRAAVLFGADAVYLAADRFGMRARAANFALEEIPAAVAFAHAHGVKVHVTCNILMHDGDIDQLPDFFRALDAAGVDAFIIGDLGAFAIAGEVAPRVERHVSTQASVANAEAAKVWHSLGAKRVVLLPLMMPALWAAAMYGAAHSSAEPITSSKGISVLPVGRPIRVTMNLANCARVMGPSGLKVPLSWPLSTP